MSKPTIRFVVAYLVFGVIFGCGRRSESLRTAQPAVWDTRSPASSVSDKPWIRRLRTVLEDGYIYGASFSPGGHWLAFAARSYQNHDAERLHVMDTANGSLRSLPQSDVDLRSVIFSPNGRWLAAGGLSGVDTDGQLMVYPADSDVPKMKVELFDGVVSLAFSPDSRFLVSTSGDRILRIWDIDTAKLVKQVDAEDGVVSASFSPDGRTLATGHLHGEVTLWDVSNWRIVNTLRMLPPRNSSAPLRIDSLSFSPNGRQLLGASQWEGAIALPPSYLAIWNLDTGLPTVIDLYSPTFATFSADGSIVFESGKQDGVNIWDMLQSRLRQQLNTEVPRHLLAVANDGRLAVKAEMAIEVWEQQRER